MKFRKIQFENHPILGYLNLDFTDKNGNTVDTIVIAGENGCGKTVLLNELYEFNPNFTKNEKSGKVITEIELSETEMDYLNSKLKHYLKEGFNKNIITVKHDYDIKNNWNQIRYILDKYENTANNINIGEIKRIYSDVEINFTPNSISSVTAKNIDQNQSSLKSTSTLSTEITQLLIDIKTLDDGDLSDWVISNPGKVPPEEIKSIRMKRFTNAFHSMFENKRFKGVFNNEGKKQVLFEEFGKSMPIDKLCSGEKQIVFRGAFLLRDKKSLEGAYVLIDEPEISLHPKWQLEILPFLKNLFINDKGEQTSQIFVTTHSPFIIHNSNRSHDKIIILQKDDKGKISVANSPEFYSWTPKQLIQEAFNLNVELNPDKINVFLEGETDEIYFKKALDVFGYDPNTFNINWIGRNETKGKPENSGDTALNHAASFYRANPQMLSSQLILLYDCDTNKSSEDFGKLHLRSMAYNEKNKMYKIGVENLLILPEDFNYQKYYQEKEKIDNYGGVTKSQTLDKMALCEDICSLEDMKLKDIMANLKSEIDKIISIP